MPNEPMSDETLQGTFRALRFAVKQQGDFDFLRNLEKEITRLRGQGAHWHSHYEAALANWNICLKELAELRRERDDLKKTWDDCYLSGEALRARNWKHEPPRYTKPLPAPDRDLLLTHTLNVLADRKFTRDEVAGIKADIEAIFARFPAVTEAQMTAELVQEELKTVTAQRDEALADWNGITASMEEQEALYLKYHKAYHDLRLETEALRARKVDREKVIRILGDFYAQDRQDHFQVADAIIALFEAPGEGQPKESK